MFKPLIAQAKLAISDTVARYMGRAAVAGFALVAASFATAALAIALIDAYGGVAACAILAALFATIALIAGAFVVVSEQRQDAQQAEAEESEPVAATVADMAASDPMTAISLAGTAISVFRLLGRHTLPLLLIAFVGLLMLGGRSDDAADTSDGEAEAVAPGA